MKAKVSNYRQAPRKVRLIADLIRGKKVSHALDVLSHMEKRAAGPFAKLIKSAVANAKADSEGVKEDELTIKRVQVDKGFTFKRYRPRARGRASKIDKHTSHIDIELGK